MTDHVDVGVAQDLAILCLGKISVAGKKYIQQAW